MTTLDVCHKQHLNDLKSIKEECSILDEKIREYDSILDSFSQHKSQLSDEEFKIYMKCKDNKILVTEQLKVLKGKCDENSYYTSISNILYQYYELIDNGQGQADRQCVPKNSIINYFSSVQKSQTTPHKKSRGVLLDDYMNVLDYNCIKTKQIISDDKCSHCKSQNLVTLVYDGYMYCKDCYTIDTLIVDNDKPSYKDPPNEITYFSYKRINHLNEWLNQIQGKETTDIPEEIYDKILLEIKKQRMTNMADLTYDRVKNILKHLKVHKYYEHIPHIINRLNGLPMPNFSYELEEKLRSMFKQIQTPFLKHSPAKRKNFLSYSYVLHKFLQLLEKDEFLVYFPLLKSRDKLASQDKIWRLICQECEWQFIPSL